MFKLIRRLSRMPCKVKYKNIYMTYQEQLLHPKWKAKKEIVLCRDNQKCILCHQHHEQYESLHIHHTLYLNNHLAWQYPLSNLISLCAACHHNIDHDRVKKNPNKPPYIQSLYTEFFNKIDNIIIDDFYEKNVLAHIARNHNQFNRHKITLDKHILGLNNTEFKRVIKRLTNHGLIKNLNLKRNPNEYEYNHYYF